MNLSISIVVYQPNLQVLSKAFIHIRESIKFNNNIQATVYLIDNSCSQEWQKKISDCINAHFSNNDFIKSKLVVSPGNIGYGRANNLVIDELNSDYHLVMNPDVFVFPETLSLAIDYIKANKEIGLLTPAVYGEEGEQHYLCKRNPTLFIMFLRSFAPKWLKRKCADYMNHFEMRDCDYSKEIKNIYFPTGCFMFFKTEIFKRLKGFDPRFFMYFEDADIGRRLLKISQSAYVPDIKIVHQWARGSHTNSRLRKVTIHSAFLYWRKWGGLF